MVTTIKLKAICYSIISIILCSVVIPSNTCAQTAGQSLQWSIQSNKSAYYPGEPVLLTVNITNSGQQKEDVDFGMDGIEAFSFEMLDSNDIIVAKGDKIQRFGMSRLGNLTIPISKIAQKTIVLNQWCSTLLPAGPYKVICNVEYRLFSEDTPIEGSRAFKASPFHNTQLELSIGIIQMDTAKFKEILETLVKSEVKLENQSTGQWLEQRETAREMLALTESQLAVPYQLALLRSEQYTWRKLDIINSLVKSCSLEAANGLTQMMEDTALYKEDIKNNIVDAVYRLRDTGKSDIINATQGFVTKYPRPVLGQAFD